ncbi:hypothetical protein FQR65_LT09083 [Abscondita terminalis]|nr:hypothetical protein FQR65_LT09083 [Abscondita terminalis]
MEKVLLGIILTVLLLCDNTTQKTITISSPKCNLLMKISAPVSQCCCSTTPPPPITTTTLSPPAPSKNKPGSLSTRTCPMKCPTPTTGNYPGSLCNTYYSCTGTTIKSSSCSLMYAYSAKEGKCVPVTTQLCVI